MRIVFMGTPDFAVPALHALVAAGHDIAAVYSQPPRPAGRGKRMSPTPVHAAADQLGLCVLTPISLKDDVEQAAFAAHHADIAVVAAYGLILPQAILDAPLHGCLNIHGSLLPRWRGAAPVQRAILVGDQETGVMIMQMEAGLDTGPVRARAVTDVAQKTAGMLTAELAQMGAALMVDILADLPAYPAIAQPAEGATYAAKIDKAETRLDFTAASDAVLRQIRAFNPAPGAWFEYSGQRYRLLAAEAVPISRHPGKSRDLAPLSSNVAMAASAAGDPGFRRDDELIRVSGALETASAPPGTITDDQMTIACGNGGIRPTLIQRAGKPVMPLADFLRGNQISSGTVL